MKTKPPLSLASTSSGPSLSSLLSSMEGTTITGGWDVVNAISADKLNELLAQQFVYKSYQGNSLPPVNGTVPIIQNISVEFQNLVLGPPLIVFSPTLAPQQANLYIKFLSGTVNTVETQTAGTAAEPACLLTSQEISAADNYWLTGTIPLASLQGEVNQGDVVLDITNASAFTAHLGFSGGAETTLGEYFLTYLQENVGNFSYSLGTIIYDGNGTNLVPVKFDFATQVNSSDPNDTGRLLLLIATTYHPDGGQQTSLNLANIIPQGYSTALIVSSQVLFENIVLPSYQNNSSLNEAQASASQPASGGAYQISFSGEANLGVVEYTYPPPSSSRNYSGKSSTEESVLMPLSSLVVKAANNGVTATLNANWNQDWVQATTSGKMGTTYENGSVPMTATMNDINTPSVNPASDVVSFSGSVSTNVSFPPSSLLNELFKGDAADEVAGMVQSKANSFLQGLAAIPIPEVNAFAVSNLLFPQQNILSLQSANVPGDLALFGSVQSPELAASPLMVTLTEGETQQFSVTRGGEPYTDVTWVLSSDRGTISQGGLYTAPSTINVPTEVLVTAIDNTDSSQTFSSMVSLVSGGISISPYVAVMSPSTQPQAFSAVVAGSGGQGVSWSINPSGVGSISPQGVYTPPPSVTAPASVSIVASSASANEEGTALVGLFPTAPSGVAVSPVLVNLTAGSACQFNASIIGDTDPAQTFNWSLLPEVGTVSSTGLYRAPAALDGPETVLLVAASTLSPVLFATAVIRLVKPGSTS